MTRTQLQQVGEFASLISIRYKGSEKGMCLRASNELAELCVTHGIQAAPQIGCFDGHPHAWVDVWCDGSVFWVDCTARQFGEYPSVILVPAFSMTNYGWECSDE